MHTRIKKVKKELEQIHHSQGFESQHQYDEISKELVAIERELDDILGGHSPITFRMNQARDMFHQIRGPTGVEKGFMLQYLNKVIVLLEDADNKCRKLKKFLSSIE